MTKAQRPHEQTGNDFVADAQTNHTVEHLMRQGYDCGLGNMIPTEQTQLHALEPLSHPVAHGRYRPGHLGGATHTAYMGLKDFWIFCVGLMS